MHTADTDETQENKKCGVILDTGGNIYVDHVSSYSDIVIELTNTERRYKSLFKHINENKGKTITVASKAATAYSLIKDTLKYPCFSGISTYLGTMEGPAGRRNYDNVEYDVPENDMPNYTLSELFVRVFNATNDKELSLKIVLELVE